MDRSKTHRCVQGIEAIISYNNKIYVSLYFYLPGVWLFKMFHFNKSIPFSSTMVQLQIKYLTDFYSKFVLFLIELTISE